MIIKTKNINVHSHKILAHSENSYNDAINLVVKEAVRNISDLEVYNSEKYRFSFILKHRDSIIEKNSRRYFKHLIQNVRRSKWSTYQIAQKLASIYTNFPID